MDDDIRIEKNNNGTETLIFDPYNPLNKLITKEQIQEIMTKYNVHYELHNIELYKRAYIHGSYISKNDI